MKKKPLPVQLDEVEREKIEALASKWGISLSGVIRRLIREYNDND
jgi:Ribbon-helix-helix protein, copG family